VEALVHAYERVQRAKILNYTAPAPSHADREEQVVRAYTALGHATETLLDHAGEKMLETFLNLRAISG
jgi:hypothetical protein